MNILIIEPTCRGHHPIYLRWIAEGASSHGHQVIIATSGHCFDHPVLADLKAQRPEFKWILCDRHHEQHRGNSKLLGPVGRELAYRANLERLFALARKEYQIDHVFVPYIDFCFKSLAILGSPFGSTPWSAIMMRGSFHFTDMGIKAPNTSFGWVKRFIFQRVLSIRSLRHVFTIDRSLYEYEKRRGSAVARSRLRYLPDPVDTEGADIKKGDARRQLGLPDEVPLVLVYGGLTQRKGIRALVRTLAERPECSHLHVILAGRQVKSVETQLNSDACALALRAQGRLHEMNRFLSPEEERRVFRASDLVWIGYTLHYWMSSVLALAGALNVPVIGCYEGVIGWWIRHKGVGVCFEDHSPASIAAAVCRLISDRDSFNDPQRAAYLARQHSIENAQAILFSTGTDG